MYRNFCYHNDTRHLLTKKYILLTSFRPLHCGLRPGSIIAYLSHCHKYIWTACSYVFWLETCVVNWKKRWLRILTKMRVVSTFLALQAYKNMHNNTDQQLTLWANTLILWPSLITLIKVKQAVQMYLCQWFIPITA